MKTLKSLGLILICFGLFIACEKSSDLQKLQQDEIVKELNREDNGEKFQVERSIPFKADFYTIRRYLPEDPEDCLLSDYVPVNCEEDDYSRINLQCGAGQGTHLGDFTAVMSFCGATAGFTYKDGKGVFIAANGDELYVAVPPAGELGLVILYEDPQPKYEAYFQDPFVFTGGTGRFEGASGGGMTDSYVDLFDDKGNLLPYHQTDHKWTGTLVLPK